MLHAGLDGFLASQPYYPCCLLIHQDAATANRSSTAVAHDRGWPIISLDGELSRPLLDLVISRRETEARELVLRVVQRYVPGPLVCVDIDALFEPQLALDPLSLLKEASRQAPLVVAWSGSFLDSTLTYAVPEHDHYHVWRHPDLCPHCVLSL